MILIFLRNGDPKSSVRMMLTNERKPNPMNSGDPQGKGLGASVVGQSWKIPLVGLLRQSLAPPAQFGAPDDPTREAPIRRMTVPMQVDISRDVEGLNEDI
jgi:hypothetical protein